MRVLVVEDEPKIAHAIKGVLQEESYAVDVAYDGDEGYQSALYEEYDLVILDRMLPGDRDGVAICQDLRKAKKNMPILMVTAKDQVRQRIEGLNAGADDYIVKPFSLEELLARAKALLRRPHDNLGSVLTVGDLVLDTATKQASRQGAPITLSPKEYALLEYLMRNQGKVLSKQHIITHVWDFDADIIPNTVESFVTYLRVKVDKPFKGTPLIHTVRGFGYKVSEQP